MHRFLTTLKTFLSENYKHAVPLLLYLIGYLTWWTILEQKVTETTDFHIIHMAIDDHIPFCEFFVIPYFLWFAYVAVTVIYLFLFDTEKKDYYKCIAFLFTGMTLFLIISTIMPNGHELRPAVMPRNNLFTRMVANLWLTDTPTNIWPSIHVYNSLGVHFAILRSKIFEQKKWLHRLSFLLATSIILSTMLIKQHSMSDVLSAFLLAAVMYLFVYGREHLSAMLSALRQKTI